MRLLSATLLLALALAGPASADGIDAGPLKRRIERSGARSVVAHLNEGEAKAWSRVIEAVSSGRRQWLLVAKQLMPGTDAGTGESLNAALAHALTRNARGVLSVGSGEVYLRHVCTVPMIEPSQREIEAFKAKAVRALRAVREPALKPAAEDCLTRFSAIP